jgi:hypothetical protein
MFRLSVSPGRARNGEIPRVNLDTLVKHVCYPGTAVTEDYLLQDIILIATVSHNSN